MSIQEAEGDSSGSTDARGISGCLSKCIQMVSVAENSSQHKKHAPQTDGLTPERSHQHFGNFLCHEAAGPWDAGDQLQELCHWWLRLAAAAAKSLQSCPTLGDPIDGSPPGSPVPGILQTRTLEWVAISFSNAGK